MLASVIPATAASDRPLRVISLAPHLTELMFSIGAGSSLVAVSEHSDFPEQARELPRVGNATAVDLEKLVSLKPDLVLVWGSGTPRSYQQRLRDLGFHVEVFEFRKTGDIATGIGRLGQLTGHGEIAARVQQDFLARLEKLESRYASRKPVRVLFQLWRQPLMTVNRQHMLSDLIRICGGSNVFADLDQMVSVIDIESVIQRKPEAIIVSPGTHAGDDWKPFWARWRLVPAVAKNHVYAIDSDLLVRQGVRVLLGAEQLCQRLDQVRKTN